MDIKTGLVVFVALAVGAIGGGAITAQYVPAEQGEENAAAVKVDPSALSAAQKEADEARAEALHWQAEAERLAKQSTTEPGDVPVETLEAVGDVAEIAKQTPKSMDAAMIAELEEYRARDRERQEREAERDDRNAERREEWAERQVEMLNRRTDLFTELIDRTNDPAEQQRWADIERNMTQSRDLMRNMREAETDEERDAARAAMRQNFESTQSLLQQQQTATLKRALAPEGVDASQVAQIQRALDASLDDEAYRMSAFGGGRGWGGGGGRGPGGGGFSGFGRGR